MHVPCLDHVCMCNMCIHKCKRMHMQADRKRRDGPTVMDTFPGDCDRDMSTCMQCVTVTVTVVTVMVTVTVTVTVMVTVTVAVTVTVTFT